MAGEPFDLETVRRRWAMAGAANAEVGAANAEVAAANATSFDLFAQARANLRELRRSVEASVGRDVSTIEPFLRRVEQAVEQIERAASGPPAGATPGAAAGATSGFGQGSGGAASKALRAELADALFDLEDLLEVFLIVSK